MSQQWYGAESIYKIPMESPSKEHSENEVANTGTGSDPGSSRANQPAYIYQGQAATIESSSYFFGQTVSTEDLTLDEIDPGISVLDGEQDFSTPGGAGQSLKRGQACSFCRRRKLKCSGERPKCTSCVKYAKDCEYAPPTKVARYKALETRISELSDCAAQETDALTRSNTPLSALNVDTSHILPMRATSDLNPLSAAGPSIIMPEPGVPSTMLRYAPAVPQQLPPGPGVQYPTTGPPLDVLPGYFPEAYVEYDPNVGPPPLQTTPIEHPFNMTLQHSFSPFSGQPNYFSGYGDGAPWSEAHYAGATQPPPLSPMPQQGGNHGPFDFVQQGDVDGQVRSYPSTAPSSTPSIPTNAPPGGLGDRDRERINAQQKAAAQKVLRPGPRSSAPRSSPTSDPSTPDGMIGLPLNSTVDARTVNMFGRPLPDHGQLFAAATAESSVEKLWKDLQRAAEGPHDPVERLAESLGEFLFNPKTVVETDRSGEDSPGINGGSASKKTKKGTSSAPEQRRGSEVIKTESDGLTDSARQMLLECFLAHSRLFFEMSVPRFRYRMTLSAKRRPSLALLYAMYLWATRIMHSPRVSPMESHFFDAACRALNTASVNADRLIDCMRAAMLLSMYSYIAGRYHEGWILQGMATRMIISTGLHQIRSCVFIPEPPRDPLLRGRTYLLGPPEDATELAERIATFWAVVGLERSAAVATGFPLGITDDMITTPFPRPFADIASRAVTQHDDMTIRDLYRHSYYPSDVNQPLARWMKASVILERASKLAYLDPAEDSEYARAWSTYFQQSTHNPRLSNPPVWLDQPKYRCPKDYSETKLALDQMREHMGVDGVFPVDIRRNALIDGAEPPIITAHVIKLHHIFAATHMFLHDINANGLENKEALVGARRAIALMTELPPLHFIEVDSFTVTVWSSIGKILAKELRRVFAKGDTQATLGVAAEIDIIIGAMQEVAAIMPLARSQALALVGLKRYAMTEPSDVPSLEEGELARRIPKPA